MPNWKPIKTILTFKSLCPVRKIMGYTAAQDCLPVDAPYNAEKDITFLKDWRRTILQ